MKRQTAAILRGGMAILRRAGGLRPSPRFEAEMREEIAHDLNAMTVDLLRAGMTQAEAHRQAMLRLGGVEQTMQAYRERRTLPMIETVMQDARFALRQLRSRVGFTVTAVLMLALGFGASVAIFAFVDAALIRPLPYREPRRLVWTTEVVEKMGPANLSWQDYEDWRRSAKSFESLAVWKYAGHVLQTGNGGMPVQAMRVSANFLSTLGVVPMAGRDFRPEENVLGAEHVAMVSYGLWQRQFGGRPGLVGTPVQLDGGLYTVIAILPKSFQFAPRGPVDVVTAIRPETWSCEGRRSCHSLNGVGRLQPGVGIVAADAEVKRIAAELEKQYPGSNRGQGGVVMPLAEESIGKMRPILRTLLAGSVLLFVIACLNVSSLLLVRSDSRSRELALRSALGASRMRLLRQFSVESAMLVATASLAGTLAAMGAMKLLMLLIPAEMRARVTFLESVGLSGHTLLFAVAEAVLACVLFVAVPALRVPFQTLRMGLASGTGGGGSLSWRRIGSQIVVLEVATAVVLLVGAGLLGRSLERLLRIDLHFDPSHLATLSVSAPDANFGSDEKKIAVQRQVAERLQRLPGVHSVGFGGVLPATYNGNTDWIRFVGRLYDGHHIEVNERPASPGYFEALRVTVLRGRVFTENDTAGKPRVIVVNRQLAEQYFPGEDPIGKMVGDTDLSPKSMRQIVGVVENIHEGALDDEIWPAEYESIYQNVDSSAQYAVRVNGDERALLPEMAKAIREVNRELGVSDEMTMGDKIHDSQSATLHRGAAWLAGAFALVALVLCAAGLYGVVMYSVSLRTRELGVRLALGSPRRAIYELVLREAGWLSVMGICMGMAMAVGAATLLRTMLFEVKAWDIPTLVGVSMLLAASCVLASVVPAHRAATVDPVHALRME